MSLHIAQTLTLYILLIYIIHGPLAQLARASALHAEGHRFDSDRVHHLEFLSKILEIA